MFHDICLLIFSSLQAAAAKVAAVPTLGNVAWEPLAYQGASQFAPVDFGGLAVDPATGDAFTAMTFSNGK